MGLKSLLVIYSALLAVSSAAFGFKEHQRSRFMERMGVNAGNSPHFALGATIDAKSHSHFIEQPVDHTDVFSDATYNQRYLLNDENFKGDGPVYLCVGGEGPALEDSVVVTGGVHCALMVELAIETNGLILALEHRYYGPSIPTKDFSTDNLKFHTSQQALADMSRFVDFIYTEYKLDYNKNRLSTWGGSYPGMMASFFRLKYPHQAWASVSSSAPVKAQTHFQGYMDVVGSSLAAESVGGSQGCQQKISSGFASVGELLQSDTGRKSLAEMFNVCHGPESLNSFDLGKAFTDELSFSFPLQSNDPLCTDAACNYEKICNIVLEKKDDSVSALARLTSIVFGTSSTRCLPVEEESNNYLKDVSLSGGTGRVWLWQTCNEFGYYQTCDEGTNCPFTQKPNYNSLQSYYDDCEVAFGITPDMIEKKIEYSNHYYGADKPAGSRIMYVNGEVDPWSALSVLTPLRDEPAYMVTGASHHQWTHERLHGDTDDLNNIRRIIKSTVSGWLNEGIVVTE